MIFDGNSFNRKVWIFMGLMGCDKIPLLRSYGGIKAHNWFLDTGGTLPNLFFWWYFMGYDKIPPPRWLHTPVERLLETWATTSKPLIRAKISHLSLAVTVKGWWNPDAILTWQNPNMVELVVSTQRWGDLTYQNGIFHQPDIGIGINSAGHFEPTGFVQKYGGGPIFSQEPHCYRLWGTIIWQLLFWYLCVVLALSLDHLLYIANLVNCNFTMCSRFPARARQAVNAARTSWLQLVLTCECLRGFLVCHIDQTIVSKPIGVQQRWVHSCSWIWIESPECPESGCQLQLRILGS